MAKKNTAAKFLEGAVAGLALGVAASIFLSSKKGKALKNSAEDVAADFYKQIAPKLKKVKKMSEKEYALFMKNAVTQYGKTKKLSADKAKELVKNAQHSWKHFAKHLGK